VNAVAFLVSAAALLACGAPPRQRHGSMDRRYDDAIATAVAKAKHIHPVPPALVRAVIRQESAFRPRAVSRAGARGLMQVMPSNARRLGVTPDELWDPDKNLLAGVRLLAVLLKHYQGDVISALVGYNARPRRLFAPVPRNGETPTYVWNVLAFYEQYRREETPDWRRRPDLTGRDRLIPLQE